MVHFACETFCELGKILLDAIQLIVKRTEIFPGWLGRWLLRTEGIDLEQGEGIDDGGVKGVVAGRYQRHVVMQRRHGAIGQGMVAMAPRRLLAVVRLEIEEVGVLHREDPEVHEPE